MCLVVASVFRLQPRFVDRLLAPPEKIRAAGLFQVQKNSPRAKLERKIGSKVAVPHVLKSQGVGALGEELEEHVLRI